MKTVGEVLSLVDIALILTICALLIIEMRRHMRKMPHPPNPKITLAMAWVGVADFVICLIRIHRHEGEFSSLAFPLIVITASVAATFANLNSSRKTRSPS